MSMSLSSIEWGLLGIIATLLFGVITLALQLRARTRTELSFVRNSALTLFETAVSNLDELSVFYQGAEIPQNLVLFQASIVNTGTVDIAKSDCHSALKLNLPSDFRWTETRKLLGSEGVTTTSIVNGNTLEIEWSLLKPDEHVSVDALVEYRSKSTDTLKTTQEIAQKLIRETSADQRAKNLRAVKNIHSRPRPSSFWELFSFTAIFLFFSSMIIWPVFSNFIFPKHEVLFSAIVNEQDHSGVFTIKNTNQLFFRTETGSIFRLKDTESFDLLGIEAVEAAYPLSAWGVFWRSLIVTFVLLGALGVHVQEKRARRLLKVLKNAMDHFELQRQS